MFPLFLINERVQESDSSCMVNTIATGDLATQGARASAAKVLT